MFACHRTASAILGNVTFATLPNPKSQWDLLIQLGPFASDKDIIAAISKGETVIETKTGNVNRY